MSVRLFFGLPVPSDSAEQLRRAVAALTLPAGWRWIPAANWHLTMLFLGDLGDERVPSLITAGEAAVARARAAQGELTTLSTFPVSRGGGWSSRARLLAATAPDSAPFLPLHEQLVAGATALGYPVEQRPLLPHVTLARRGREAAPWPEPATSRLAAAVPVERLVLYRSDTTAAGRRYTELWSGALRTVAEQAP